MNETEDIRVLKEGVTAAGEEAQTEVRATEICATEAGFDAGRSAAFFDLDGTLVAKPSLERRFWRALQSGGRIPLKNYAAWLWESLRLLPQGWNHATRGNKAYLRGVKTTAPQGKPAFLADGIECMLAHARRGHRIVLVSGTLEPLALRAAAALREELRARGCEAAVHICATRLEATSDGWTGKVLGEPMFGEAKVRAVRQLAKSWSLELSDCYAYGDSEQDRWMLAATGHACAVNPSRGLRRTARLHGWTVLRWGAARTSSQETQQNDWAVARAASEGKQPASEEPA